MNENTLIRRFKDGTRAYPSIMNGKVQYSQEGYLECCVLDKYGLFVGIHIEKDIINLTERDK